MYQWLFHLALILGPIPFAIICFSKRLGNSHDLFYIKPYLFFVVISNIYEFVGTDIYNLPTAIWFKVCLLFEFFTILYYFYNLLGKDFKAYFYFAGIFFMALFLFFIFNSKINGGLLTDSYLSVYQTIFVFISVILWFRKIFIELPETSLLKLPDFYFVSGFILYFSGTLFLFLLGDLLFRMDPEKLPNYWTLIVVFNIILSLFLIQGV